MTNSRIIFLLSIIALNFQACKKNEDPDPEKQVITVKQSDQSGSAAIDSGIEDVNDIINNRIGNGSSARLAAYDLPCGVVSLDSTSANAQGKKIYKVKYGNQSPCGYKKKSGDVNFQLINGNQFSDTGAVYLITFINYTVEVQATKDIVTVNGTIKVSNQDGGYLWQTVLQNRTVRHKMRGSLSLTYANGSVRERKYFQMRTWSSTGGWAGVKFSVNGDTTINNQLVSETGSTLEGNHEFITTILKEFTWENCGSSYAGPYVLKTGKARMNLSIPNINPAFYEVEAGYQYNTNTNPPSNALVNDCESDAYKISIQIGTETREQYQLY